MAVEFEKFAEGGIYLTRVTGAVARTDMARSTATATELADAGELKAVIVDARQVEFTRSEGLVRDMWDDSLSILPGHIPIAYIAPPGFAEVRLPMVREILAEWEQPVGFFEEIDAAAEWVSARIA